MYQRQEADIWSDFEICLTFPDYNNLENIFDGYAPDFFPITSMMECYYYTS